MSDYPAWAGPVPTVATGWLGRKVNKYGDVLVEPHPDPDVRGVCDGWTWRNVTFQGHRRHGCPHGSWATEAEMIAAHRPNDARDR